MCGNSTEMSAVARAGQPGEEAQSGLEMTAAEQATVRRRILIGAGLAAATAAFAGVPTESLRLGSRQPCYAYLVPVLRSIVRCLAAAPLQTADILW